MPAGEDLVSLIKDCSDYLLQTEVMVHDESITSQDCTTFTYDVKIRRGFLPALEVRLGQTQLHALLSTGGLTSFALLDVELVVHDPLEGPSRLAHPGRR